MQFKQQRGISTLGFMFTVFLAVFVIYTAFKVVPPYAENRYIISALNALASNDEDVFDLSNGQIRDRLIKFYTVNNVRSEGSRNIDIDRRASRVIVTIAYEEEVEYLHNISLLFRFNNQLDSSTPERCCSPVEE